MKVGFLITARLKSTRLPGKLLQKVSGKPIFVHMLDRLKLSKRVDQIIVCTSINPGDDQLVLLAASESVSCFRGDEDDVLKRLYDASCANQIDYILNVTADCPFVDPYYADRIVETFEKTNADMIRALDLPHGAYCYGIKPSALKQVLEIKTKKDSEVWGRYFTDTDLFDVIDLPINHTLHQQPELRMTLDYPEDLQFFKEIFEHLYQPGKVFSLDEILLFLKENPQIVNLNKHCELIYEKRATKQSSIELKPRYTIKKALILGCGSIGQRHIRNLLHLGIKDIVALRSNKGHFKKLDPKLNVQEVMNWDDAIDSNPDVAFICNPTGFHIESARRIVPHVRGVFIEKPIGASLDGVKELLIEIKQRKLTSFVGFNLQFHPAIHAIQTLLENDEFGEPILFQCQAGQWLPDWHPYEVYQKAYYAVKELGGGATLTLSHEVRLATELLGRAKQVFCKFTPSEKLPLDVDVISDLTIQHETNATSKIRLDFIQRPLHRSGLINCERGRISYDLVKLNVSVQQSNSSRIIWEDPHYDSNDSYIRELETFLKYTAEGRIRHESDIWQAVHTQAIMEAAFRSSRSKRFEELEGWTFHLNRLLPEKKKYDKRKIPTFE